MATQSGLRYDPSAAYPVTEEDVVYLSADGAVRYARVYQPDGPGPFPVLVSVHGGAWSGGDHTNNAVTSGPIAASGVVVMTIGLRVAPEFPYPAQVQDANLAIRWARMHAEEYNGDPGAVGGIGYSSGGHTLPLAGMRPADSRYSAHELVDPTPAKLDWMIVCWPVIDSHARYEVAKANNSERLVTNTEGYFLNEDAMHEGNPQELLDRGESVAMPPTLVIHGTADENVPVEHAERFAASYAAAGGSVRLEKFEGEPHGFANEPGEAADRMVEVIKQFIAEQVNA
ncbi:MAG: alpha/beta hydrolase [Chloroflexota bacterium]|nr:alpha/beta hydrolase [Deltaproteobacteria bacterium]MDE2969228.1 alpha/beta hydrolase [Chloroflexota bacterium]